MAIPDCHVVNKWPVRKDEHLCNVNQALLECTFPLIAILNEIEKGNGDLSYIQKAVHHSLCHFSLVLHDVTVDRQFEILCILGINTKILPKISSINVASDENIQ
uniref:Uncharacterized protein n=1 Tax=Romanomermis culicivorax TaxID=13658 RepID=A0A915KN85_ROMCU